MLLPIKLLVDAFTHQAFTGNPAAVCLLPTPQPESWMLNVAKEMNLSETAFLLRQADSSFNLRWFTPAVEVDLCGHATLASAHVLWSEGHLPPDAKAQFHTHSGVLTANHREDWIELNFPALPAARATAPRELEQALNLTIETVSQTDLGYLIEVKSEAIVRQLQPDFTILKTIPVHGVIVTSPGTPPFDCISRYFAPRVGINEDPVTGSAHCCLAPYWCDRLGKSELLAYQASARGGIVKVRLAGDRVYLSGQAVTVLRGEMVQRKWYRSW
jgi:PhzF family phenazine biosynthesis protein